MDESLRKKLDRRHTELLNRRQRWEPDWQECCEHYRPFRARWYADTANEGKARESTHVNNKPVRSLRIMVAGFVAGMTSPTRPWFKMTTNDKELKDRHDVSVYLSEVEEIIREVLAQARFYQEIAAGVYPDLGAIANAAMIEEEEPDGSVRFEAWTIGTYCLDVNSQNEVDTAFHQESMSVRQIVKMFGYDACPRNVKEAHNSGNLDQRHDVVHAIFPNDEWQPDMAGSEGAGYLSKWWVARSSEHDGFLREAFYQEFPVLAPRLNVVAKESYGRGSPGWEAIGDCKALQHQEQQLAQATDKIVNPPMKASGKLRQGRASLLPGDVTYIADAAGAGAFEPVVNIPPAAVDVGNHTIARHEQRIEEAFFVDLWLSLLRDQRAQRPTATEVERTREEVMLQLGPILENLNTGLLEPVIVRTYHILARNGRLPEPPPELEGTDGAVKVEFISVLHQAQKLTGIVGIRELGSVVQSLAALGRLDALDKLNVDAIVDEITEMLGVKPELVLSEDQVNQVRAEKAKQEAAAQQGEAMLQATEGARNLSAVDPQKLEELGGMVGGVAAGQAGLM